MKKKFMKGQFGIVPIVIMFVSIIIFAVLYTPQQVFINNITQDPTTPTEVRLLFSVIPVLELIGIALIPVIYSTPQREYV